MLLLLVVFTIVTVFCMVCLKSQIAKLQRVQIAAGRLATNSHITPALRKLHWLSMQMRIHFKKLISVFKAIHGLTSYYLCELIGVKPKFSYNLRSNGSLLLEPPRKNLVRDLSMQLHHVYGMRSPIDLRDTHSF